MLQILAHTNLLHELVFVAVHAGQLSNMGEYVLNTVGKLKCVDISQAVLDMGVNDEFGEAQDFTTQVEGVTEARLFTLLCSQGFDGLQVEVVVQMKVVEVLAMDEEVEHVVALATDLEADFNPVEGC